MTMTLADLVVKLRSDGVQQAKQDVTAVGDAAKATAEQLDALAKKMAASNGGGNIETWRAVVEKAGLTYAQAADKLSTSTNGVAKAAEQVSSSTGAAAKAAQDLHGGFDLSTGTLIRAAGALTGVGLGLSAAVGIANQLHDAIGGVVNGQLLWEQSLVRTQMLYGATASSVVSVAQAQAQMPGVLGSQQEFLQSNLNAAYLSSRYGLPQSDIYQLTTAAGRVSDTLGLDPQGRADLQSRFLQFADSGGNGLRDIGLQGDPYSIAKRLGFANEAALQALTPSQLKDAQTQMAIIAGNQAAAAGSADKPGLLAARTNLEKALTEAQGRLQNSLEGRAAGSNGVAGQSELALQTNFPLLGPAGELQQRGDLGLGPGTGNPDQPRPDVALKKAVDDAQKALDDNTNSLGGLDSSTKDAADKLNKMGVEAGSTTARLLSFTGSLEDPTSIARGDIAAQALASVTSRAIGPNPQMFQSEAELQAQATNSGYQQAYQVAVAKSGQQQQNVSDLRNWLQNHGGAPAVAEADRRSGASLALEHAQNAGNLANLQIQQSQNDLDEIALRQKGRLLEVTQRIADSQKNELQIARDNLGNEQLLIQAREAQLGPQGALLSANYTEQRLALVAQQEQAKLILGQPTTGMPDLTHLDIAYRDAVLNHAASGVDVQALDAQHRADLAQLAVTGGSLAGAGAAIPGTRVQIDVAIKNLGDTADQIVADLKLIQGQEAAINAQRAQNAAQGALANVQLVINADGSVRLADDAIASAAQAAYDLVEQELSKGLGSADLGLPAPTSLAGARRPY